MKLDVNGKCRMNLSCISGERLRKAIGVTIRPNVTTPVHRTIATPTQPSDHLTMLISRVGRVGLEDSVFIMWGSPGSQFLTIHLLARSLETLLGYIWGTGVQS